MRVIAFTLAVNQGGRSSFLKAFVVGSVTMSAGRSLHMFTTLWLNLKLCRSSLDRSFFIFREGPRTLEVSGSHATERFPGVCGEFYTLVSCLPCSSDFTVHFFENFHGSYNNPSLTSFYSLISLQMMKIHVPLRRADTVQISKRAVEHILKPPYLRCLRLWLGVSVHW